MESRCRDLGTAVGSTPWSGSPSTILNTRAVLIRQNQHKQDIACIIDRPPPFPERHPVREKWTPVVESGPVQKSTSLSGKVSNQNQNQNEAAEVTAKTPLGRVSNRSPGEEGTQEPEVEPVAEPVASESEGAKSPVAETLGSVRSDVMFRVHRTASPMGDIAFAGRHKPFGLGPYTKTSRPQTASPRSSFVSRVSHVEGREKLRSANRERTTGALGGGVGGSLKRESLNLRGSSNRGPPSTSRDASSKMERESEEEEGGKEIGMPHTLEDTSFTLDLARVASTEDPAELHRGPNGLFVHGTVQCLGLAQCLPMSRRPSPTWQEAPSRPISRGSDPRRARLGLHTVPARRSLTAAQSMSMKVIPPWDAKVGHDGRESRMSEKAARLGLQTMSPLMPAESREAVVVWDHPIRSRTPRPPSNHGPRSEDATRPGSKRVRAQTAGVRRSRLSLTVRDRPLLG